MNAPTKRHAPASLEPTPQHVNDLLDEALDESFPASDPVAISLDRPIVDKRVDDEVVSPLEGRSEPEITHPM